MRWLLLMSLAACGGARAPAAVENRLPTTALDYLVWTSGEPGTTTAWLSPDGESRGTTSGIVIAAGGTLWRLEAHDVAFPLRTCDEIDHGLPASGTGEHASGSDLTAVPLGGGTPIPLGEHVADDGDAELEWATAATGSAGPYLFVETHASSYACGAHGGESAWAHVYDLSARTEAPPIASDADIRAAVAPAEAAFAEEGAEPLDDGGVRFAAAAPVWTQQGLGAKLLMIEDACYACGNGLWESYTSGTWVPTAKLPAALAELPDVPAPVLRDASGISWGVPDDTWKDTFHE